MRPFSAAALALHAAAGWLVIALPSCAKQPIASVGETVVVVDTDMSVPSFVNRLRVDVFSEDGQTWYTTHDTIRATPGEWPYRKCSASRRQTPFTSPPRSSG